LTTRIRLKDSVNPLAVMNSSAASVSPLSSDMVTRSDIESLYSNSGPEQRESERVSTFLKEWNPAAASPGDRCDGEES
jgi:hypothetical protein